MNTNDARVVNQQPDHVLYGCRDCHVWDPANQPSVQRELEADPNAYAGRWFAFVYTPHYAYGQRLSVELVICRAHEPQDPKTPEDPTEGER